MTEQHTDSNHVVASSSTFTDEKVTDVLSCSHQINDLMPNMSQSGTSNPHGRWLDPDECEPLMYARRVLYDPTYDLHRTIWVSVPHTDFWSFLEVPNALSFACTGLIFLCLGWLMMKASKLRSLNQMNGWEKITKPVIIIFLVFGLQVVVW